MKSFIHSLFTEQKALKRGYTVLVENSVTGTVLDKITGEVFRSTIDPNSNEVIESGLEKAWREDWEQVQAIENHTPYWNSKKVKAKAVKVSTELVEYTLIDTQKFAPASDQVPSGAIPVSEATFPIFLVKI